ncbi:MAG: phenylalanine--tRNA ligase subunit beta [Mahellales bacterium]|jgi:phenylalanyl-tRNA synthetase beta chain
MLVPINWIRDYVDIDCDIKEYAERMTMSGSKVEAVNRLGEDIQGVVVGKIQSVERHPNADKLLVCRVDIGSEVLQIVTGAPNVKEGDYVPVAVHGSSLPNGVKIKRGKLRGVASDGMLCSGQELQLTEEDYPGAENHGILILKSGSCKLGQDIKEALGMDGYVVDFEITPNRPDCLSMIGMARETAATLATELKMPDIEVEESTRDIRDLVSIDIKDKDLCFRYSARVIENVKIEPSPPWLKKRLKEAGVRPINNIVDITNYVMLEYGQPMHAFDLDRVGGRKIVVRRAQEGETLVTLDKQKRSLSRDMLVIADEGRALGLAGIMGGLDSEISADTSNILLESATFERTNIRQSSKKLGLRTEASSRFEKGLDANMTIPALDRAAQLINRLSAGSVARGIIDVYPSPKEERLLKVKVDSINRLLGIDITAVEMSKYLSRLGFMVKAVEGQLEVQVPSFRDDIEGMADIAEEVARIYGYDKIPATLIANSTTVGGKTHQQQLVDRLKDVLSAQGLYEITTYSFVSPKIVDILGIPAGDKRHDMVRLKNPLGEDQSAMRTTLVYSMLEVIARNINRNITSAGFFEISSIFIPRELPMKQLPDEFQNLCIGVYGPDMDFFRLKGIVQNVLTLLGIQNPGYEVKASPYYHPGRSAIIYYNGTAIGEMGEIHPDTAEKFDIDQKLYVAELDLSRLLALPAQIKKYKPLPKFPAVTRDLALIVKDDIRAKDIEDIIYKRGGDLIESIELFDVYKGSQIKEGHKSMAYSITYRSQSKTLTDDQVNKIEDKILNALKRELSAQLRS